MSSAGAALTLDKNLAGRLGNRRRFGRRGGRAAPADALVAHRPEHAQRSRPALGSDVPACLLSMPARGDGGGDVLTPVDLPDFAGTPVLLVNPRVPLSTADVFARWDGSRPRPA